MGKVLATLAREGFAPSRLSVEITETGLIENTEVARRTIEALNSHGVQEVLEYVSRDRWPVPIRHRVSCR
ncbi:hypothetical protein [Rubellimicrobium roseum]|uniref:hypothetical protein n=1 Tax=Rubellimicrobium roseum TaxID=687525 RepID=UPI00159B9717|nr:hypothetical protein [Rubellimicrobium roseum]